MASGSELGARKTGWAAPTQRAPGPDTKSAGARHRERRAPRHKSRGPTQRTLPDMAPTQTARERRGSTQRAAKKLGPDTNPDTESDRAPGPHTESAGPRRRERRAPTQRTLGPETARERRALTHIMPGERRRAPGPRLRERPGPTQRASWPDTESGGRAPGADTECQGLTQRAA